MVQEDKVSHCTAISRIPNKWAFRYHLNCPYLSQTSGQTVPYTRSWSSKASVTKSEFLNICRLRGHIESVLWKIRHEEKTSLNNRITGKCKWNIYSTLEKLSALTNAGLCKKSWLILTKWIISWWSPNSVLLTTYEYSNISV